MGRIVALILCVLITACASSQVPIKEINDFSKPFLLKGASVLPPQKNGWGVVTNEPQQVVFSAKKSSTTTLIAFVRVSDPNPWPLDEKAGSEKEFVQIALDSYIAEFNSDLLKPGVDIQGGVYPEKGKYCVRLYFTALEEGKGIAALMATGYILNDYVMTCVHPHDRRRSVVASLSCRKSTLSSVFKDDTCDVQKEVNSFFDNIEFRHFD